MPRLLSGLAKPSPNFLFATKMGQTKEVYQVHALTPRFKGEGANSLGVLPSKGLFQGDIQLDTGGVYLTA